MVTQGRGGLGGGGCLEEEAFLLNVRNLNLGLELNFKVILPE